MVEPEPVLRTSSGQKVPAPAGSGCATLVNDLEIEADLCCAFFQAYFLWCSGDGVWPVGGEGAGSPGHGHRGHQAGRHHRPRHPEAAGRSAGGRSGRPHLGRQGVCTQVRIFSNFLIICFSSLPVRYLLCHAKCTVDLDHIFLYLYLIR